MNSHNFNQLVQRAKDGLLTDKISKPDYGILYNVATARKISGNKTLDKIEKLRNVSRSTKENKTLRSQKAIWRNAWTALAEHEHKLQQELDVLIGNHEDLQLMNIEDGDDDKNEPSFVDRVMDIRQRVKSAIAEKIKHSAESGKLHKQLAAEKEFLNTAKAQLNDELAHLENDPGESMITSPRQADMRFCPSAVQANPDRVPFERGIPAECEDWPCPDLRWKIAMLQQFLTLDEAFEKRLEDLRTAYEDVLSDRTGGWSKNAHWAFTVLLDQYPNDTPNRRDLLLDRMKRQWPKRTHGELLAHERLVMRLRHYHQRLENVLLDWKRDRDELRNKLQSAFEDLAVEYELALSKEQQKIEQEALCTKLHDEMVSWRQKRVELDRIEQQLAEERRARELEAIALEQAKERQRRMRIKQTISEHRSEVEAEKERATAEAERRADELRGELEAQAELDKERVEFRLHEQQRKAEERRIQAEQLAREEMEREARLETLREKVRPVPEFNPVRMMGDTEAWRHRVYDEADIETPLQQPLFATVGYTAKQINSDPRLRVEQRLREAGLHTTDYARTVLKAVRPAHEPRRDMLATANAFVYSGDA